MINTKNKSANQKIEPVTKKKFYRDLILGIFFAGVTILLFADLAEDLLYQELTNFDHMIIGFIQKFASESITNVMIIITTFGSKLVIISVSIITVYLLFTKKRHYWESLMVVVSLSGGWLLNEFLKLLFHRQRPDITWLVEAHGYSFPSGHAMLSAVFYGFLAYLLWGNFPNKKSCIIAVLAMGMLILFIGISRIYLGVHYPSDVLAGFAAGGFWLTGCILATQTIRYYKS